MSFNSSRLDIRVSGHIPKKGEKGEKEGREGKGEKGKEEQALMTTFPTHLLHLFFPLIISWRFCIFVNYAQCM
jgi:hypothetical protein